jgi:chromosomal replication initiation ATPase DnaA
MRQTAFDLGLPPRFGAADFLVTPANRNAFVTVERWPDWPDRVALLVGPEGAGKSHLGAIWAARAGAETLAALQLSSGAVARLGQAPLLLDDADRVGTEADLFHALNLLREHGQSALLTARAAPDSWGLRTPDLLSRLRLAPLLRLEPPDDALIAAVLVKLFADRQLTVDASLLPYLSRRMERSIGAARRLVAALDQASLAAGRRITRGVAAEVLATLDATDASGHGVVTRLGDNPAES